MDLEIVFGPAGHLGCSAVQFHVFGEAGKPLHTVAAVRDIDAYQPGHVAIGVPDTVDVVAVWGCAGGPECSGGDAFDVALRDVDAVDRRVPVVVGDEVHGVTVRREERSLGPERELTREVEALTRCEV